MTAQVDYFTRATRVRGHILYIRASSCSYTSSASIQLVLYSPVQDLDPLLVVYTGVIPYVPYGHTLYWLLPTSSSQSASTHLGHPRSINSDPISWISCDSARIGARDAIPLPPSTERTPAPDGWQPKVLCTQSGTCPSLRPYPLLTHCKLPN